jgi:hypothetical protein
MGGDLTVLQEIRARVRKGAVVGPRIFCSGPILDGPGLNLPSIITVNDPEEAADAVEQVHAGGADFIKVYSFLSRESYFAIAREAKRRRMTFVGHVPLTISVAEASAAGQRSVEHLSGILMGCSDREDDLRRQLWQATEAMTTGGRPYSRHPYIALTGEMLRTFNANKCEQLFRSFVVNDTWQTPTLVAMQGLAYADDETFRRSSGHLEYLGALGKLRQISLESGYFRGLSASDFAAEKQRFQKDLELVSGMQNAGVKLLAGSDSPNPFDVPGFALHGELELFVKAGLTPAQALRTATCNTAAFLRLRDDGSISPGKLANLVVLRADPLADIRNTRQIDAVIVRGKLLSRPDLDKLLEGALTARRRRFGLLGW